jgi:hypothetical protein
MTGTSYYKIMIDNSKINDYKETWKHPNYKALCKRLPCHNLADHAF